MLIIISEHNCASQLFIQHSKNKKLSGDFFFLINSINISTWVLIFILSTHEHLQRGKD